MLDRIATFLPFRISHLLVRLLVFAKRHLDQRNHRILSRNPMWVSHDLVNDFPSIASSANTIFYHDDGSRSLYFFSCAASIPERKGSQAPRNPSGASQGFVVLDAPSMSVSQKLVCCTNPGFDGTPTTSSRTSTLLPKSRIATP
jgi:hypothetical protein